MRAIVLDLDDTLYLERDFAVSGYLAVADRFADRLGDRELAVAAMRYELDHGDRRRVFDGAVRRLALPPDPELIREMIEAYGSHPPKIALLPDAERALARWRGRVKLGLVSDGPAARQRAKIAALGISGVFDAIVLTDELGPGLQKPHTAAFVAIQSALNALPEECTYVADNPSKDFVAPNRLGWASVRVLRPGGMYADVRPAPGGEPARTVASLDELD